MPKSPAQLNREIAESLAQPKSPSTANSTLFAVEIDPAVFDEEHDLPHGARWRKDLIHLAEDELARGRTHRRPKAARYAVVEWFGMRGAVGRFLEWDEASPGITRYAEIFA